MISSVRIFTVATPRRRANRRTGRFALRLPWRSNTSPTGVSSKSTAEPALMPSKSRTFLGIVTWPLDVTVVVMLDAVIHELNEYYFSTRVDAVSRVLQRGEFLSWVIAPV